MQGKAKDSISPSRNVKLYGSIRKSGSDQTAVLGREEDCCGPARRAPEAWTGPGEAAGGVGPATQDRVAASPQTDPAAAAAATNERAGGRARSSFKSAVALRP